VYEKIIKSETMEFNELMNDANEQMKGPKGKPQALKERDAKLNEQYKLFKSYYNILPNRQCNTKSEEAFKTLTNEQRELAIKNVVHYIALFEGDDINYIAGATKFLNEGLYMPDKIQEKREWLKNKNKFTKPENVDRKDISSNFYEY
jgi:hypothetical protein